MRTNTETREGTESQLLKQSIEPPSPGVCGESISQARKEAALQQLRQTALISYSVRKKR